MEKLWFQYINPDLVKYRDGREVRGVRDFDEVLKLYILYIYDLGASGCRADDHLLANAREIRGRCAELTSKTCGGFWYT